MKSILIFHNLVLFELNYGCHITKLRDFQAPDWPIRLKSKIDKKSFSGKIIQFFTLETKIE